MDNKQEILNSGKEKHHDENIEHQKELHTLEDVSHQHEVGFDKHKLTPEDQRNLKNQKY
jgi:hypothetical protein